MRLRDNTIGTLNLLREQLGELDEQDRIAARAFADVATIGILHERSLRETAVLAEQLQGALTSRIVIEQAKGVVAYTNGVSIEDAFALIRKYARSHQVGHQPGRRTTRGSFAPPRRLIHAADLVRLDPRI